MGIYDTPDEADNAHQSPSMTADQRMPFGETTGGDVSPSDYESGAKKTIDT